MATIIRNPLIDDYIVEMDSATRSDCDKVRERYENGYLVLLSGEKFDLDYQFLNSIDFDVAAPHEIKRKMKKYSGERIASLDSQSSNPLDRFVYESVFNSDDSRLEYYKAQIESGNNQSRALYEKIFPRYATYRTAYSWRFTETMFENLHWDNFGIDEVFHQVRIFVNVARSPRLWRTSHRIRHYADLAYNKYDLGALATRPGDDLNRHLNNAALGGMKSPCLDGLPKHHIAFKQGDIWLCETRLISHQIYHGERAFAAMYYSDPASMDNPALAFDHLVSQIHLAHAGQHSA